MGGVVDAIEKGAKKVGDFIEDTADTIEDGVKKGIEIIGDTVDLTASIIMAPVNIVYDTVVKGDSFSKSLANEISNISGDLRDLYRSALDDTLGIDDSKFLGIKGGLGEKLGSAIRDFTYDHASETLGIAIIVATVVASIIFPPVGTMAGSAVLAAFNAGVTSTFAMMSVYYASYAVITLGISAISSGIINGAVLGMYGGLLDKAYMFEKTQETLRIASLGAILDGTIFDRLAGGYMYDSQYAGGVYYDATTCANPDISVGGEFNMSPFAILSSFGFQDLTLKNLAGDDSFSILKVQ